MQSHGNGHIFFINSNGFIIGSGARIHLNRLLMSTLDISDQNFLDQNFQFTANGSNSHIVNHGLIDAASGGYVALLGNSVQNHGTIIAQLGRVELASGNIITASFGNDNLLALEINAETLNNNASQTAAINNTGVIQASGGRVILQAKVAAELFTHAVNNQGIIEAHSISQANGTILLKGMGSPVTHSGSLSVKGIDAVGGTVHLFSDNITQLRQTAYIDASGSLGGSIMIEGYHVGLFDNTAINASGELAGGTILVGGGLQGLGEISNAWITFVGPNTQLRANALSQGDGGTIIVWADDSAYIYGHLSATGGTMTGHGGFVETSGKNYVSILQVPDVSAVAGQGGQWLIDPNDITIVDGSAQTNINSASPFVSSNDSASLGTTEILMALLASTTVTISTGSGGTNSGSGNITVDGYLFLFPIAASTLILNAANNIIINNIIENSGSDPLNIQLNADNDIIFSASGSLITGAGGGDITLTADADSSNAGAIVMADGSLIDMRNNVGNTITLSAYNNITLGTIRIDSHTVNINSSQGQIIDGGDSLGADIIDDGNGNLNFTSLNGLGISNAIDIHCSSNCNLSASTQSGNIAFNFTSPIEIDTITQNSTSHDIISLNSNSDITFLSAGGSITSYASGAISINTTGITTINGNSQIIANAGDIDIDSDQNFTINTNGIIQGGGTGSTVTIASDDLQIGGSSGGAVRQSGSGTITLTSNNPSYGITLSNNAVLAQAGLISINASTGSIMADNVDIANPEVTSSGNVSITAKGITGPLEIGGNSTGTLTYTNTSSSGSIASISIIADVFDTIALMLSDPDITINLDLYQADGITITGNASTLNLDSIELTNTNSHLNIDLTSGNIEVHDVNLNTGNLSLDTNNGDITVVASGGGITAFGLCKR